MTAVETSQGLSHRVRTRRRFVIFPILVGVLGRDATEAIEIVEIQTDFPFAAVAAAARARPVPVFISGFRSAPR